MSLHSPKSQPATEGLMMRLANAADGLPVSLQRLAVPAALAASLGIAACDGDQPYKPASGEVTHIGGELPFGDQPKEQDFPWTTVVLATALAGATLVPRFYPGTPTAQSWITLTGSAVAGGITYGLGEDCGSHAAMAVPYLVALANGGFSVGELIWRDPNNA